MTTDVQLAAAFAVDMAECTSRVYPLTAAELEVWTGALVHPGGTRLCPQGAGGPDRVAHP